MCQIGIVDPRRIETTLIPEQNFPTMSERWRASYGTRFSTVGEIQAERIHLENKTGLRETNSVHQNQRVWPKRWLSQVSSLNVLERGFKNPRISKL